MHAAHQIEGRWNIAAAVAGWAVPGLGHYLLGQRRRGGILLAAIGLLWLGGLLLGGISVIDHREHPAWFLGQMLMAPSVLVDSFHQHLRDHFGVPLPHSAAYEPSFGHVNEQGTLYTALAGLLNLLAVLDVLYREADDAREMEPQAKGRSG